jgi:hypothetical protein
MRIVMRDLAQKGHDRTDEPYHDETAEDKGRQDGGRGQRDDRDG